MAQPPLVLDPPAPLPVPPGLFSVATMQDIPLHGYNFGAIWVPDTCGPGEVYPAPCQTPPYPSTVLDGIEKCAFAFPFVAYASIVTGLLGVEEGEATRRVRQRLINTEQTIAERALWGGTTTLFTGVPNWAGKPADGTQVGAAGVAGGVLEQVANAGAGAGYNALANAATIPEAVSLLEQSLADNYYGQGIIHARSRIAAFAGSTNQFRMVGLPPDTKNNMQYTQNLNVFNFGNGYAGTGPTGQAVNNAAAGTEYMWATGRILIWRDAEIRISDSSQLLNKSTNQRNVYAWRNYMIGIECFAAVTQVTRP